MKQHLWISHAMVAIALAALPNPVVAAGTPMDALPVFDEARVKVDQDWLVKKVETPAAVYRSADGQAMVLANGILSRTFQVQPNLATVSLKLMGGGTEFVRGVKPEAVVEIDGVRYDVGGMIGQPDYAYLDPAWLKGLKADPHAMAYAGFEMGPIEPRMQWKQVRHHAPDAVWPPKGVHLRMDYDLSPGGSVKPGAFRISVHYELYDDLPLLSKWITVRNTGDKPITVNHFTSELLAAVEYASDVDTREGAPLSVTPGIQVATDYAFGGMSGDQANRAVIHWVRDPDYATQVNYTRDNPCLLTIRPDLGPAQVVKPGETFESFRAFELPQDSTDRERQSLAVRRMYRVIAPWVTENPLMLHERNADAKSVKAAIDQCADVGFEMVILSFGSGFNIENESPKYLDQMTELADYAHAKGIEIGGYSLLASRSIDKKNNVVMPPGKSPIFGNSPCLGSEWGENYFRKLYQFYQKTGFTLLEHDGSYPGDPCTSTLHPGHLGLEDSQWNQWRTITDFYKWCRGNGVYLNVPDWYFLAGSSKTGMGYRETDWSLPRDQQVIHVRQNIFDGTWSKTPSMGWMFVPLTEYHGGGAAATIEPLDQHLDHYERMLVSNLALGVQACYRGPRLYDTDRTRALVKQWVDWYRKHREILESDVIHGRRADGRDVDWMLHVNPCLNEKGMLVVFNPLDEKITRTLTVPLYYTGLTDEAKVRVQDGGAVAFKLDREYKIALPIELPARGFTWVVFE